MLILMPFISKRNKISIGCKDSDERECYRKNLI